MLITKLFNWAGANIRVVVYDDIGGVNQNHKGLFPHKDLIPGPGISKESDVVNLQYEGRHVHQDWQLIEMKGISKDSRVKRPTDLSHAIVIIAGRLWFPTD